MARPFKPDPFYLTKEWRTKRREVLQLDHYECQFCKARGKYTRATHVHHVKPLKDYPEYALAVWIVDETGRRVRQLISCCRLCHETVGHPERLSHGGSGPLLTEERW